MQTKDAMFESFATRDTRAIAWVKRACLVSVYLVIGMIAAYRALVQLRSFELRSPAVLQPGSAVSATKCSIDLLKAKPSCAPL